MSDVEPDTTSLRSNCSAPNSPLLQLSHLNRPGSIKGPHSSGAICESEDSTVSELRKQLREKDMKLTDIRLEALTSAHQLEQLRETMNKMRNEMSALKADNDRLTRMVTTKNLNMSTSSLHHQVSNDSLDRSLSLASSDHGSLDIMQIPETPDREGKRVTITVYLGSNPDPTRAPEKLPEVLIGSLSVSGKTKWDILDNIVRKIFKVRFFLLCFFLRHFFFPFLLKLFRNNNVSMWPFYFYSFYFGRSQSFILFRYFF
ncbi:neuron navigator 3-like isoform X2 [Octopus bimaculoides]|uniref:neuron navigator 3-like isoform X2 n=1 Tax=Octopus bimaculoides TaxID=37653 RepID=UPI0022E55DCB|nr:neuron navigator 3-like isoform X2 [Octopus bimaculoides]